MYNYQSFQQQRSITSTFQNLSQIENKLFNPTYHSYKICSGIFI